jgi:hypothetical protein
MRKEKDPEKRGWVIYIDGCTTRDTQTWDFSPLEKQTGGNVPENSKELPKRHQTKTRSYQSNVSL